MGCVELISWECTPARRLARRLALCNLIWRETPVRTERALVLVDRFLQGEIIRLQPRDSEGFLATAELLGALGRAVYNRRVKTTACPRCKRQISSNHEGSPVPHFLMDSIDPCYPV